MLRGISTTVVILSACAYPWMLYGQADDPFSVRVESNLVVVYAEVADKRLRNKPPTAAYEYCYRTQIDGEFQTLLSLPSQPWLAPDCSDWLIHDLSAADFHVFQDGAEQKIQTVEVEPRARMVGRDNLGWHGEWSHSPKGKWSASDVPSIPGNTLHGYSISYVPSKLAVGSCHRVQITVSRPNAVVFAPDQYCYIPHPATDPLLGTPSGKQLEADLNSDLKPKIPLRIQASVMYVDPNAAQVDIVMEFPWSHLKHRWIRDDIEASIRVLGVVYTKEGTVAARFSDSAYAGSSWGTHLGYDPGFYSDEYDDPIFLPSRYETQINLPSGEYELRVVLSDGEKFGRAAIPLKIDDYDGKQLAVSSVVLFKRFRNAGAAAQEAAYVKLAPDYLPLVSQDRQITPTADTSFSRKELVPAYFEVYDPLLAQQPAIKVQAQVRIVSVKTGAAKTFERFDAAEFRRAGTTTFAIAKAFVANDLAKGEYRLEIQASDSAGHSTPWGAANFTLK